MAWLTLSGIVKYREKQEADMIIQAIVEKLPIESRHCLLIVGSIITALAISLGMVGGMHLLGLGINPAIPAAVGAVGGAVFAARQRR